MKHTLAIKNMRKIGRVWCRDGGAAAESKGRRQQTEGAGGRPPPAPLPPLTAVSWTWPEALPWRWVSSVLSPPRTITTIHHHHHPPLVKPHCVSVPHRRRWFSRLFGISIAVVPCYQSVCRVRCVSHHRTDLIQDQTCLQITLLNKYEKKYCDWCYNRSTGVFKVQ